MVLLLDHLRKSKDMLELDKSYLSRELTAMASKYDEASRLVEAQKSSTMTAELKVCMYVNMYLNGFRDDV